MLVQRRTYVVKPGCVPEAVAWLKAAVERLEDEGFDHQIRRIYAPTIPGVAPPGIVAVEWEFESLAEYEKAWRDWLARPGRAEGQKRWHALLESGGTNEIWNLVTWSEVA